ncbi:MAG: DUF2721 domain-containing protein [Bacteroidota bacterium]|nr:DUF2721 domain-containing protein [Bacteroidota bacterium]
MHQQLSITTPALLFPTVSLLLLSYGNRYVAISNRIRLLYAQYKNENTEIIRKQIHILRRRIHLIRNMQLLGIASVFFAAATMFLIYQDYTEVAGYMFGISQVLLLISLLVCSMEIILSTKALDIQIEDLEKNN